MRSMRPSLPGRRAPAMTIVRRRILISTAGAIVAGGRAPRSSCGQPQTAAHRNAPAASGRPPPKLISKEEPNTEPSTILRQQATHQPVHQIGSGPLHPLVGQRWCPSVAKNPKVADGPGHGYAVAIMEVHVTWTATERFTWDEIRSRYPDEWVVLVDIDWIEEDGEFRTAVVLGHGRDRRASLREASPVPRGYCEFAHEFTGAIRIPTPAAGALR